MGYESAGRSNQRTRDEIGDSSSTFPEVVVRSESIPFRQRASAVVTKDYASFDGFILEHSSFGVLGTNKLGNGGTIVEAFVSINNPKNTWIENFDLEFFEDTTSQTASWDTSNKYLEFTNSVQTQYTKPIFLNDNTKSVITLNHDASENLQSYITFYYDLNGDVIDASTNSYDGTLYGTALFGDDRLGAAGGAYILNGTSSYIDLGGQRIDSGYFTLSVWVYIDSLSTQQYIISQKGNDAGDFFLAVKTDGKILFRRWTGTTNGYQEWTSTSLVVTVGAWRNIVISYNAGGLDVYLNNSGESPTPTTGNDTQADANTFIGRYDSSYFDGLIDEVLAINFGLTQSQVDFFYDCNAVADFSKGCVKTTILSDSDTSSDYAGNDFPSNSQIILPGSYGSAVSLNTPGSRILLKLEGFLSRLTKLRCMAE